ncbi:MAG: helix-turn-helix domain-containing protein [Oscillibacter sp.]
MKFQQWPKRDPDKNYFKVPNEVFHIGLSYPEISVYCYLLSMEDRETYQCYPSYKTIGKALGMSENTVSEVCAQPGGERSHPHRADDGAEQRRQAPQRESALHHPSDPGGSRTVLRAAVPTAGGGCRLSEGGGTPRRIGP